ncbi:MAG TPA: DUF1232 domain-containing protein [bacterium]|nr:DUF1232 domain-containing protein [bacterium]
MINELLKSKAQAALKDKKVLNSLLYEATVKADANKGRIRSLWSNLKALARMVRAWAGGQYSDVPWRSLVAALAALIYFVNPFDLIPDFLIVGLADDALFVGWVLASIQTDLSKFLLWEKTIPVRAERVE